MKLGDFIRTNQVAIVSEWERFAATQLPAASGMSQLALRDHIGAILEALMADIELPQGRVEQAEKSKGLGEEHRMESVAAIHAALRIQDGFRLTQLVAEYRALRASVLRMYSRAEPAGDLAQVTRFNEAIDEALAEASTRFMVVMDRTRDQFLGILGHDLRNPLGAIMMSAAVLSAGRVPEARQVLVAGRILTSAGRMSRMVDDLLDLTRTRLGSGIPIAPQPMNLKQVVEQVVLEFQSLEPERRFEVRVEGNLEGSWDSDRLAQVLSNLLGNATKHGAPGRPIGLHVHEHGGGVLLEVHNEGRPIPPALLTNIFEPMVQGDPGPQGLGLGLHIAREIVLSHGGTIRVTSTAGEGTTFSVALPRRAQPAPAEPETEPVTDVHDATGSLVQH